MRGLGRESDCTTPRQSPRLGSGGVPTPLDNVTRAKGFGNRWDLSFCLPEEQLHNDMSTIVQLSNL